MRYSHIMALAWLVGFSGCSSETSKPPAASSSAQTTTKTSADAASTTAVLSPKNDSVIVISATRKDEDGPVCESDMGAKGKSKCGPKLSLTELSWEFTEHRDGSDYYKFDWNLTSDGKPKNSKGLTVGFDGDTEATVIDAEHYIVIRKGPLNTKREEAE